MSKELIDFIEEIAYDMYDRVSPGLKDKAKELLKSINSAQRENSNVSDNVESQRVCVDKSHKQAVSKTGYCSICNKVYFSG